MLKIRFPAIERGSQEISRLLRSNDQKGARFIGSHQVRPSVWRGRYVHPYIWLSSPCAREGTKRKRFIIADYRFSVANQTCQRRPGAFYKNEAMPLVNIPALLLGTTTTSGSPRYSFFSPLSLFPSSSRFFLAFQPLIFHHSPNYIAKGDDLNLSGDCNVL